MRKLTTAVLGAMLLASTTILPAAAHGNVPDDIDVLIHAAADYRGASYWQMYGILRCESGNFDRRVINGTKRGAAGEIGIAQLLPTWSPAGRYYGTIATLFESRGGDYWEPSDQIYFLAFALTHGYRSMWHC